MGTTSAPNRTDILSELLGHKQRMVASDVIFVSAEQLIKTDASSTMTVHGKKYTRQTRVFCAKRNISLSEAEKLL